ncbi:MAG: hypothetical protein ACXW3D_03915 [Caulobacteraceae bacterium]
MGGRPGVRPSRVIALGVKVVWAETEIAGLARMASAPVKHFDTREAAVDRFLKVSGLSGLIAADSSIIDAGIVQEGGGWRLAADPATALVGPPPMDDLVSAATCPVRLAAGEHDPMSRLEDLRRWDEGAAVLAGLGHNAMVENPLDVWDLLHSQAGRTHLQA